MRSVGALLGVVITVLVVVYVYNAFLAPKGQTIADLGKKAA